MSVDALVADSAADFTPALSMDFERLSRSSTPALPPGLPISRPTSRPSSRPSTPSAPPGLPLPHAHPSPILREVLTAKPQSRIVPTSAPFTPSRNPAVAYIPRAATPLATVSTPTTPVKQVSVPKPLENSTSQARQDVKSLATNSGLSKTIASQAAEGLSDPVLRADDFPVLEKGKEKASVANTPKSLPATVKKTSTVNETATTNTATKSTGKRSTPGILNVSTSNPPPTKVASASDTPVKALATSAFPPLPPSAPSSAVAQSPAIRSAPKTLRLVPTPKTESVPISTSTPPSATSVLTPHFPPSRQPSLASLTRLERPGTPVSEIISDNASITSTSMSRPGTPPPSKVGSAPVRSTTKSQQKKHRREAQKEKEKSELDTVIDQPEPEVEIAPIMGRKKKQKKERTSTTTNRSTPAVSRAPSPVPQKPVEAEESSKPKSNSQSKESAGGKKSPKGVVTPVDSAIEAARDQMEKLEKIKLALEEASSTNPTASVAGTDETAEKPIPTPSSVLLDLVSAGLLPDPNKLVVFKSPIGTSQRFDFSGDLQDLDHKLVITEEDRAALQAGKPVHKVVQGSSRIMLTPNGECVRNLTPGEEERYLELQSRIMEECGPAAFVAPRHSVGTGFTLIGGRAVPNGPPAFFPPMDSTNAAAVFDPVSKIQRDEALSYINQYVLPSLSTNSQLERALNANALDAEMLRPNESQSWGSWGAGASHHPDAEVEHPVSETPYGATSNDGILATGLESMTAHFGVGRDTSRGQPLGNVTLLSLTDSESAMQSAKKETEKLEKSLNQLLKKNRRLLLGTNH
jgi:CCR4-NOT transcription complex subunit 4